MTKPVWLVIVVLVAGILVLIASGLEPAPPLRVGILHSLSGDMAISEKPVMQATLLAIEEINKSGGLLERTVEPILVDGKSDPAVFAREAERLIRQKKVEVIFGCWTSSGRKNVKSVVEKYHHLLFYPVQYEGLEFSPNIFYLGAAPNQQIVPAVTWTVNHLGRNIYLLGSDYVFPHAANWLIKKQLKLLGANVVGESYLLLGEENFENTVRQISKAKPDAILSTINGESNVALFRALESAGITSKKIPVLSFSIAEPELEQMNVDLSGHYVAWNYFQSSATDINRRFIANYRKRFGDSSMVSDPAVSAWAGVHIWAAGVRAAQSAEPGLVKEAVRHTSLNTPMGTITIDHRSQHTWKTPRIGRIRNDGQIDEVWAHNAPVRPEPFPHFIERGESERVLQRLYQMWNRHWQPENSYGDLR